MHRKVHCNVTTKKNKDNKMQKAIPINNLIFEKIKFRYDFYNADRAVGNAGGGKLLLDTFYPFILATQILGHARNTAAGRTNAPAIARSTGNMRTGYAISERISNELGCKKLHISELITMLGYTKTDISKLLQHVKNKSFNLVLVGLGGTGSNFLHWTYEMSQWVGKDLIFNTMFSYDDDDFDIPNMLRIPFEPNFVGEQTSSKKVDCIPPKFKQIANNFRLKDMRLTAYDVDNTRLGSHQTTLIYGAPDIATRKWLSDSEYTFIAATHRDSEFSLVENPAVDDELMMETYGKINVSKFMLNHLTMTIKFLEHLRDRDRVLGGSTETQILREDFDTLYANQLAFGFKAGAKRLSIHSSNDTQNIDLPEENGNE